MARFDFDDRDSREEESRGREGVKEVPLPLGAGFPRASVRMHVAIDPPKSERIA